MTQAKAHTLPPLKYTDNGLICAIAQDEKTGDVLMQAWMNEESFNLTLETGIVHYWSRSRQNLWKKGETSGHIQHVKDIRVDCDNDCVLVIVDQVGAACHTGRWSCFFKGVWGKENPQPDKI